MVHKKDKNIFKLVKRSTGYTINSFHGTYKERKLICMNNKLVIPTLLQKQLVEW